MHGAEVLLRTLLDNHVDVCFMNPGTSEMQFVSALDRVPGMRGVLCLFEGVASGAADGYARMTRRPAATLLHLGPGLGNGLANFHNARKARSPVVSIVGEHSTDHLRYDAPLTADIRAFAGTVSHWVRYLESADDMGAAACEAVRAALEPPGQIATLIVPADFSWSDAGRPGPAVQRPSPPIPDAAVLREASRILRSGEPAGILLDGSALLERGIEAAGRIAQATGCRVFATRFGARMARGGTRFVPERIPYFPEPAERMLAGLKHMLLVEAKPPVSFFGYPGRPGLMAPPDCEMYVLAHNHEDGPAALEAVADGCGRRKPSRAVLAPLPEGPKLTPEAIGRAVAALLPEGALISEEAVSCGEQVWHPLTAAPPHEHLPITGGAIGQCLPVAVGAAVACPDRKVIALEADGSGMYTLQALWTMARERLDVVTVIFANRRYRILDIEIRRTGAEGVGPQANDMMDLTRPDLDWVKLAEGHGVEASSAATADEFVARFRDAMNVRGPRLIEAVIG